MHPNYVLIHCQPTLEDYLTDNNIKWQFSEQHGMDEIDAIVDDIPYEVLDGTYQDPAVQLCEHYGIDYNQINCVEAIY